MKRIRSKRQRPLGFEALEGRLALSAGMGLAGASHHADAMAMSQSVKTIPASFKGHTQIVNGTQVMVTGLKGTIGKDHFAGFGSGTVAGTLFAGGNVYLSNGKGTVQLGLDPAVVVKVRKALKAERLSHRCRRHREIRSVRRPDRALEHMEHPRQAQSDRELFRDPLPLMLSCLPDGRVRRSRRDQRGSGGRGPGQFCMFSPPCLKEDSPTRPNDRSTAPGEAEP